MDLFPRVHALWTQAAILMCTASIAWTHRAFPIASENFVIDLFQEINPRIQYDYTNYLVDLCGRYAQCSAIGKTGTFDIERMHPITKDHIGGLVDFTEGEKRHVRAVDEYLKRALPSWNKKSPYRDQIMAAEYFGCSVRPGCKGFVSFTCCFTPALGKDRTTPAPTPAPRCFNPPSIEHASHDGSYGTIYPVGSILDYRCQDGYRLEGRSRAVCQAGGWWEGPQMTCVYVEQGCVNPPIIDFATHGGNYGTLYPVGSSLDYSCRDGYRQQGQSRATCQSGGWWDGPQMTCVYENPGCTDPPYIDNAYSDASQQQRFPVGTTVRYSCVQGYNLDGQTRAVCLSDGRWDGPHMTCTKPRPTPKPGKQKSLAFTKEQYAVAERISGSPWDNSHFLENLSGYEADCEMVQSSSWNFEFAKYEAEKYGMTVKGIYGSEPNVGTTQDPMEIILKSWDKIPTKEVGCSVIPDCMIDQGFGQQMYVVVTCVYSMM